MVIAPPRGVTYWQTNAFSAPFTSPPPTIHLREMQTCPPKTLRCRRVNFPIKQLSTYCKVNRLSFKTRGTIVAVAILSFYIVHMLIWLTSWSRKMTEKTTNDNSRDGGGDNHGNDWNINNWPRIVSKLVTGDRFLLSSNSMHLFASKLLVTVSKE